MALSRTTLAQQAYEELLGRIHNGSLRPGDRLIEVDLADELQTSRGPIREAISMLRRHGVIVSSSGGASIITPTIEALREIYSVRAVLEGYASALIVERRDEVARRKLAAIVQRMRAVRDDRAVDRLRALDAEFHNTLVQAANNGELERMWEQLATRVVIYKTLINDTHFANGGALADMHERQLEALALHSPSEAETRTRAELIHNGEVLTAGLRLAPPEESGRRR